MPESLTHRHPGRPYRSAEYRAKAILRLPGPLLSRASSVGIADMRSADVIHSARALVADNANRELPILWGCGGDAMSGLSHGLVRKRRAVLAI